MQETVKVRRLGEQCRRDVKIWGKLGTQTSALWLDNLMFVLWRASEIKSGLHVTKKTLFGFIRDMPASEMSGAFEDLGEESCCIHSCSLSFFPSFFLSFLLPSFVLPSSFLPCFLPSFLICKQVFLIV
ncbi:TPA: hypothetical protein ACH3X1_016375 [Trebouxia sp. C0004]